MWKSLTDWIKQKIVLAASGTWAVGRLITGEREVDRGYSYG